jgi:hypothetical protein
MEAPSFKRPGFGFNDGGASSDRPADPIRAHFGHLEDQTIGVEVRDIDGKFHPDCVHPAARLEHHCTLEMIASEQAAPQLTTGLQNLNRREDSTVTD